MKDIVDTLDIEIGLPVSIRKLVYTLYKAISLL